MLFCQLQSYQIPSLFSLLNRSFGRGSEENAFFLSRNWNYSSEIRLIYQTIFTMPLFKLFGSMENWALIRSLNTLLNNIVLLLSYFFMARQLTIKTKWIFVCSFLLLIPLSFMYWDIVTFGGYYIFFIAQLFCCIGLFIKLLKYEYFSKALLLTATLFAALSFLLGIQGIRAVLCVHIPLLLTSIYLAKRDEQKKNTIIFWGVLGFILGGIGYAINISLLRLKYDFGTFGGMRLENLFENFLTKFAQSITVPISFFGFSSGASVLSLHGVFSIAAIVITAFFVLALIKLPLHKEIQEHNFIKIFFVCCAAVNIFVFIVTAGGITDRYFIPFMILFVPLAAIFFEHVEETKQPAKRITIISLVLLFSIGQSFLNFQNMANSSYDANSSRKGYIQYLLYNNLDYGFATFWNANVTTELSNGQIEMAGLEQDALELNAQKFKIQLMLNKRKFFDPSWHQGKSFLLLTYNEWIMAQQSERTFAKNQPDYNDGKFIIFLFPSSQIIYHEILDE